MMVTDMILLLEMEGNGISDISINKLEKVSQTEQVLESDRRTGGLYWRMGLPELSSPPTVTS